MIPRTLILSFTLCAQAFAANNISNIIGEDTHAAVFQKMDNLVNDYNKNRELKLSYFYNDHNGFVLHFDNGLVPDFNIMCDVHNLVLTSYPQISELFSRTVIYGRVILEAARNKDETLHTYGPSYEHTRKNSDYLVPRGHPIEDDNWLETHGDWCRNSSCAQQWPL